MSHHSAEKVEPAVVVKSLEESLVSFQKDFPLEAFAKGNYGQHPVITLLTCSDSRMPVNIFGEIFNRIFSVENIGNQVKTNEGSILYGLLHLQTPLMIVAGHTDCGAIKAAESNFLEEPIGIRTELSIVKNSLDEGRLESGLVFDSQDKQLYYSELAELNVDMQIKYLLANRAVADLVDKKELMLLGVMADLHNVYGNGYGALYTSNVNGECKKSVLQSSGSLGFLADRVKRLR
ncbi:MAG: carbonic anhydrase [Syntrophomonadaceae bacterium]|nr:carbonic anhydrase [Syntrophomonadaceae bacterium]MDD3023148.1 carbonic anhydrase [Syntrophomonadaceae bacterium]